MIMTATLSPSLSTDLSIRLDDLQDPRIAAFLEDHLADMRSTSPPESVHALDLAALRRPEIQFWTVWQGEELLGTGAIKLLGEQHAELKSMRTAPAARGRGVARALLHHILSQARSQGLARLSLETGTTPNFAPAHALYLSSGFVDCGPFGGYVLDPFSRYMTLAL